MNEIPFNNRLEARNNSGEPAFVQQYWRKLLFMHWKWNPVEIQKTLPPGLFVDTFKGDAYVSLIPFFMEEVKVKKVPLLGFSNFIEVNVRTYVYDKHGFPGVWFYSLDINSWIAAKLARMSYSLPYFYASLRSDVEENEVFIYGERAASPKADIKFRYQRSNEQEYAAAAESLDFFLLERYALFSYGSNCLYRGRVHHAPYQISTPEVLEWSNDLLAISGFNDSHKPADLAHYSHELLVDICKIHRV